MHRVFVDMQQHLHNNKDWFMSNLVEGSCSQVFLDSHSEISSWDFPGSPRTSDG